MKLDLYLSTKQNFKLIKDLNMRPDTLNLIKEKLGVRLNSLAQERLSEQDADSTGIKTNN